jgi:hypothetical protein
MPDQACLVATFPYLGLTSLPSAPFRIDVFLVQGYRCCCSVTNASDIYAYYWVILYLGSRYMNMGPVNLIADTLVMEIEQSYTSWLHKRRVDLHLGRLLVLTQLIY